MRDFIDDYFELFVTAIGVIIVVVLIVAALIYSDSKDTKKWNNGYCSCGGCWEYQQAVGHRYDTDYIYKCDKCGKIEEFEKARRSSTEDTTTHEKETYMKCPSCGYYEKGINYCPKCGTRMVK